MWTVASHYQGMFIEYMDMSFTLQEACRCADRFNKKYDGGYVVVPLSFARREI